MEFPARRAAAYASNVSGVRFLVDIAFRKDRLFQATCVCLVLISPLADAAGTGFERDAGGQWPTDTYYELLATGSPGYGIIVFIWIYDSDAWRAASKAGGVEKATVEAKILRSQQIIISGLSSVNALLEDGRRTKNPLPTFYVRTTHIGLELLMQLDEVSRIVPNSSAVMGQPYRPKRTEECAAYMTLAHKYKRLLHWPHIQSHPYMSELQQNTDTARLACNNKSCEYLVSPTWIDHAQSDEVQKEARKKALTECWAIQPSYSRGGSDVDDAVATQLREAANAENDPARKEKLMQEYIQYKKSLETQFNE